MARHGQASETTRPVDSDGPWEMYYASAIGADHVRAQMPNQDGVLTSRLERADRPSLPVFAVADGHGHIRHFRSDRGSRFAVNAACSVAGQWAAGLPAAEAPSAAAASQLVSDIVARWRELVAEDLANNPITDYERVAIVANDPPEIPYGSTLLIGVLTPQVAVLGQVGDGEIVLILPDGRELTPVPTDSRLDGTSTTSLCQPDAVSSFRVALVNLGKTPVFGVFASTDGYSNAQAEDNWRQTLAADLVRLASANGTSWIGDELPGWAATCASSDGSGDDTTVAIVLNTSVALAPPARRERQAPFAGPGRTLAYETVPGDAPPGRPGQSAAEAETADQRRPAHEQRRPAGEPPTRPMQPAAPRADAAASRPGASPPTAPAQPPYRPDRLPWEPQGGQGPPAPGGQGPPGPVSWSAPPAGTGISAFVLQPRVWLSGALVLGLAVALVLVFGFHNSPAKSPLPQTGATTLPPSHPSRSGSPVATPTTRNSASSLPVPTPSIPSGLIPGVSQPMATYSGCLVPLPICLPLPPGVTVSPGLLNTNSDSNNAGAGRKND